VSVCDNRAVRRGGSEVRGREGEGRDNDIRAGMAEMTREPSYSAHTAVETPAYASVKQSTDRQWRIQDDRWRFPRSATELLDQPLFSTVVTKPSGSSIEPLSSATVFGHCHAVLSVRHQTSAFATVFVLRYTEPRCPRSNRLDSPSLCPPPPPNPLRRQQNLTDPPLNFLDPPPSSPPLNFLGPPAASQWVRRHRSPWIRAL